MAFRFFGSQKYSQTISSGAGIICSRSNLWIMLPSASPLLPYPGRANMAWQVLPHGGDQPVQPAWQCGHPRSIPFCQSTWTAHVPCRRRGQYHRHAPGSTQSGSLRPGPGRARTSRPRVPPGPGAGRHFLEDLIQRLGARVFGGQHRQISQLCRSLCHHAALLLVAQPCRAKHSNDTSLIP